MGSASIAYNDFHVSKIVASENSEPKHLTANLLQIYKRNVNFQISAELGTIAELRLFAVALRILHPLLSE